MFIIDENTIIQMANTQFVEMSGYSKEEIEGQMSWTAFVLKEDLARMKNYHATRRTDNTLAPRVYEFSFLDRYEKMYSVINNVTIIPGTKKSVASLIDVTERKQAEAEQARLQQEIIEAQRRAIQELSTPIIPVMDGIIVMPLIGSVDSRRAQDTMRTLLKGIREQRAKVVILDITGVPIVDTGVAAHLDKTIQAARLKGARVIVTGISDSVAESVVDLGIDWHGVETLRDLQTGLVVALNRLGIKLVN